MFHASQLRHQTINFLNEQNFVTFLYLMMKLSYVVLISFHLVVFKFFIGSLDFAFDVIEAKEEWEQSGIFPRVTVCDFSILRVGQVIHHTIECVLPLNMFNEKIFTFFFFWLCLLLVTTIFSICLWIQRLLDRRAFFRKLLDVYTRNEYDATTLGGFGDQKHLLQPESPSPSLMDPANLEFGSDMRVVLGLVQDQTGLIFCSNVFKAVVDIQREHNESPST